MKKRSQGVKLKYSIDKRTIALPFFAIFQTKSYHWKIFLHICNNISEENGTDKPALNNVNRLNHSSPMNNTVTNKIHMSLNYTL